MLGEVLTDGVIVTSLGLIAIALASIAVSAVITASPFIALGLAVGGVIAIFKNFETVKQFLEPITTLIGGLITTLATPELFGVFNSGLSLLGSLFATLQPTLIVSGILLAGIFGQLFTFGQYTLTTLYPVLLNLVSAFLQFAEAVLPPLIFVIGALITVFSVQLLPILQVVGAIFTQVFAGILMSVTGVITVATGIINIFVGGLKALITGDLSQFSKGVGQVFDGIKAVIAGAVKTWLAPVTGAIDGITNFLRGIDLAKIGLDLINNLANGIRNGAGAVGNAIKGAFANISLPLGLKVPAFADGGLVQGRNTLAMLNDGGGQEFVMNARATRNNFDLLRALNSGKIDQSQINNKQEVHNFSTRVDQYSENNPRFKK